MSVATNDETKEILQRLTKIETLLEVMTSADVTAKEALALSKENSRRLDKIERIIFWAGTTVVGSVILALMALIVRGGYGQ